MRLSTLARKINKTPTQLIAFLEEKEIELLNGLHSKLESETVDMVYNHFIPEQIIEEVEIVEGIDIGIEEKINVGFEEIENHEIEDESDGGTINEESDEKEVEEKIEKIEELPVPPKKENIEADIPVVRETKKEQKTGTLDDLENDNPEEIELIKAKKVKLEGIKVVGKIELSEKPKKENDETEEVGPDSSNVKTGEKPIKGQKSISPKFDRGRMKNRRGRNRNPLTYDEKLKKEEREKLKERRQKNKVEKLRKKKYYQENIQAKTNPNPIRKKKKQTAIAANEKALVHKNPVKRLWVWLNGKYDSY